MLFNLGDKMKIPFCDLNRQYDLFPDMQFEIDKAILNTVSSGIYIGGQEVKLFEEEFAKYQGVKYAISCGSGTDALYLALMSLGIGKGDEVITTPYTYIATVSAIERTGATPVFVDINDNDFLINVDKIEEKITDKTKAILPVHLFGSFCAMVSLDHIKDIYKLKVIEDCAQTTHTIVTSLGCFSFFPSKILGCFGDGGMITTNKEDLRDIIIQLKSNGSNIGDKYNYSKIGINSRLDSIQAAILRVKLPYLDEMVKERRKVAEMYSNALNLPIPNGYPIYSNYVIRVPNRDSLRVKLANNGVETMIYYPKPLHLQECFRYLRYKEGDFPNAEKASKEALALPFFVGMTETEVNYVCDIIKEIE